jgi:hypothetical protein
MARRKIQTLLRMLVAARTCTGPSPITMREL